MVGISGLDQRFGKVRCVGASLKSDQVKGPCRFGNVDELPLTEHRMTRAAALLFSMFAVAGCENPWASHSEGEMRVLSRSWMTSEQSQALEPVYCYRNLAGVECFIEPLINDARQLIETYR